METAKENSKPSPPPPTGEKPLDTQAKRNHREDSGFNSAGKKKGGNRRNDQRKRGVAVGGAAARGKRRGGGWGRGRGRHDNHRSNDSERSRNPSDPTLVEQTDLKPEKHDANPIAVTVPANNTDISNNNNVAENSQNNRSSGYARMQPRHGRGKGRTGKRSQATGHAPDGNTRKPKNTTDFTRRYDRPDMRIIPISRPKKMEDTLQSIVSKRRSGVSLSVHDVIYVDELFCNVEDLSVYDAIIKEVKEACHGKDEKLFKLWHGDSHFIADDKHLSGSWKDGSPTLMTVIRRIESFFNMKIAATRLNWYRPGEDDWKPFHHDRAAFTPDCPQNFTVAATFGPDTREIGFQHARTHSTLFLPIPNGSAYTFSRDINIEWKHGVIATPEDSVKNLGGRISIIAWGLVDQSTAGSRVTAADVPTAADLGL